MKNIINKLKGKLHSRSFLKNVLIMLSGTVLGQMCTVLLSPALTRIYSPELFGILGFFTAIIGILSPAASLRYDMAVPLAQNKEEAANLLSLSTVTLLMTSALFLMVILLIPSESSRELFGSLFDYRYLLPFGFFCLGAYQVMIGYATWFGEFKVIARTKVYQGVSAPVTQIILGLSGFGALGLIAGYIIGQSAGVINMVSRLVIRSGDVINKIRFSDMVALAKKYRHFPIISTWSSLISAFGSSYILMVMIPILYSNTVAGFVFLTDRIIGRPLLLISTSILQVYLGEAAKTQNSDPVAMRRRFLQITRIQFGIVFFWLVLINATAFYFVPIVFGEEWAGAAIYINILSISYLPQMVMISVAHTLQILEKQGLMAVWELTRFVLILGGFAISSSFGLSAEQALLLYSATQGGMQVTLFFIMYHQIQKIQPKNVPL